MKQFLLQLIIFALFLIPCMAQDSYNIPTCKKTVTSKNVVGDRLKLAFPTNKEGTDIDFSNYAIAYGKRNRFWMSGVSGPLASSGQVPIQWMNSSTEISKRIWKANEFDGVDAKGKLSNGNYWRYFGKFGEEIRYYDVPAKAADYFDRIINTVCFEVK